jgi:putative endopeptidase
MKKLLIGAAIGALLLPASVAIAQVGGEDHDHACMDESCSVHELFQTPDEGAGVMGYQGTVAPSYGTWGFDLAGRDMSVRPGDDFMRHANGSALDRMQIPSDRTSYGAFALLRELSDNRVKAMIEALIARTDLVPGSDEQKIADAYRSYMDEDRIEALDARPLQPYLAAIRAANTHDAMAVYMGQTQGRVGASIFGTGISIDQKAPTRYVVSTGQSGIGLPNRDYYLDARWAQQKVLYQAYVARMLEMIGWENPTAAAEAIVAFETRIAEAHWTPIRNRNRDETYNEYTIAQLASEAPGFAWQDYYTAIGVGDVPRLVVRQNTAMPLMAAIYAETPIEVIQAWQAFHSVDGAAPRLSRRFADAQWEFRSRDLQGQPMQRSRDKRGISFAEGMLGEAVGRQYVAEYFPAESRAQMEELVANLRIALGNRIPNYSWMSDETKAAALDKLAKFTVKIGYPDKWRDYSALEVRPDDLFGNTERAGQFRWQYQLNRLNDPVDKDEWGMTAADGERLLQLGRATRSSSPPPSCSRPSSTRPRMRRLTTGRSAGSSVTRSAMASTTRVPSPTATACCATGGHRRIKANFDALTARLGAQYDTYEPLPGFFLQGGLTMGENIGDAAGVAVGLEAYHLSLNGRPSPVLDGTTGDQRFFYGWAQVWQTLYREEALRQQVTVGPHSPAEFRVIGPLRNVDAWYEAFDVQPGDRYYLTPEERVRIW